MIQWILILIALCAALTSAYLLHRRIENNSRAELHHRFMEVIAANLRQNLKNLQKGNLLWRRLGHGQSTIGLKKIAPRKSGIVPVSLETIAEKRPDIVEEVEAIDSGIDKLQHAANRLASVLEEPVRKQFHGDRNAIADRDTGQVRRFRKWLIDHEDAWMEMLANLINNGQTLTEQSDPALLYWQHSESSYHAILKKHGDPELRDLQSRKSDITDRSLRLLEKLEEES